MAAAHEGHIPVLLDEVLGVLSPGEGERYADATAGLGGHAVELAVRVGERGSVVLNDLDPANLAHATERVREAGVTVESVRGNLGDLPGVLAEACEGGRPAVDMLLADLGFASTQVDDPERGLSFRASGPLDMRLDPEGPVTAADLVNELDEAALADLIWQWGEDRASRRIARKVVAARAEGPILTTDRLAEIVRSASPPPRRRPAKRGGRGPGIDGATRTFQALRIAVNDEIGSLERFLGAISAEAARVSEGRGSWLAPGARIAIIAFHSLEDRPVKRAFAELDASGLAERVVRKPVVASPAEIAANPRARSAKLRCIRLPGRVDS